MVFEKLTLFELHFEESQFGPKAFGESEGEEVTETEAEPEESGGGVSRLLLLVGVSLLLSVAAALAARRFFGSDDEDGDGGIEIEDAGVEHAVEN